MKDILKNKFYIAVVTIIILSIFLRFVNYSNRWGLAYDQAHDALIARHAVAAYKLPLLGPFSSAGPFQTGGEWYWIIMFGTILYPFSVMSPWVFMTFLYVCFVGLIIYVAKQYGGTGLALIVGLFAAISPAEISQGTNLTNQSPLALCSLIGIACSYKFIKTGKSIYLFFLSLIISFAISIHLEGAALGILLLATLLVYYFGERKKSPIVLLKNIVINFFTVLCGLLIPLLPLLFADMQNSFHSIRNMYWYYVHDQYNISLDVLGRRWLTYAGLFIPKSWGFIIGGNIFFGYFFIVGIGIATLISLRTMKKELIVLLLSVCLMIGLLRYTRTPLFESYLVFLHPFILLLSGWAIYLLYKKVRIAAIIIIVFVCLGSFYKDYSEITLATNNTAKKSIELRAMLSKRFPGHTFTLYDHKYHSSGTSFPLALFLDEQKKIEKNGIPIGIIATTEAKLASPILSGKDEGIKLVDLRKKSKQYLTSHDWVLVTPEEVYRSTEEWYR